MMRLASAETPISQALDEGRRLDQRLAFLQCQVDFHRD